jgi:hypothetical protein
VIGIALLTQPAVAALVGWLRSDEVLTVMTCSGVALVGLGAGAGEGAGESTPPKLADTTARLRDIAASGQSRAYGEGTCSKTSNPAAGHRLRVEDHPGPQPDLRLVGLDRFILPVLFPAFMGEAGPHLRGPRQPGRILGRVLGHLGLCEWASCRTASGRRKVLIPR